MKSPLLVSILFAPIFREFTVVPVSHSMYIVNKLALPTYVYMLQTKPKRKIKKMIKQMKRN